MTKNNLNDLFTTWRLHLLPFPYSCQSKGKYEVMVGTYKNNTEMVDLYVDLVNKFPSIIALIDPFRKEVSRAHPFYFTTYI